MLLQVRIGDIPGISSCLKRFIEYVASSSPFYVQLKEECLEATTHLLHINNNPLPRHTSLAQHLQRLIDTP